MERITIPYAVADFIDLRERKFYYVDKTSFIPDWRTTTPRSSCVPVVSGKAYSYPLLPVTTIAPRPIVSRNCSAALGSGNTRRRNIAAT